MFNVRPPELLIFNNVLIFSKCLKISHKENKDSIISENIHDSDFIDTLGNVYKFYQCSLREALNFLRNQPSSFESKECIISLVEKLIKGDDSEFCKKYLIEDSYSTNIVVTSCPHLKNKFKFLYHLLMYFRSFECEK